jgi:uncharacterized protein
MDKFSSIFIDTSYLISFFHTRDSQHELALSIGQDLDPRVHRFVITDYIFLETVTVLSQRAGKKIALKTGSYLKNSNNFWSALVDNDIREQAWNIFSEIEQKNISFVDCSSVAVMKSEGIKTILTFDTADFVPLSKKYKFKLFSV